MTIDPQAQKLTGAISGEPVRAEGAPSAPVDPLAGAAFRALMEKIEENVRALDRTSESLNDPRRLGEAVSTAGESVQQAVLLGSDLLEAYRAAQQRGQNGGADASQSHHPHHGSGGGR